MLTSSWRIASSTPLPAISLPKSFNFLRECLKCAVDDLCCTHQTQLPRQRPSSRLAPPLLTAGLTKVACFTPRRLNTLSCTASSSTAASNNPLPASLSSVAAEAAASVVGWALVREGRKLRSEGSDQEDEAARE